MNRYENHDDEKHSLSIRKILVPIDKTPLSIKAANYGIHLARIENAKSLVLLNIVEDIKQGGALGLQAKYGNMKLVEEFENYKTQSARELMALIREEASGTEEIVIRNEVRLGPR